MQRNESELLVAAKAGSAEAQHELAKMRWEKIAATIKQKSLPETTEEKKHFEYYKKEVLPWLEKAVKQKHGDAVRSYAWLLFTTCSNELEQCAKGKRLRFSDLCSLAQKNKNLKTARKLFGILIQHYKDDLFSQFHQFMIQTTLAKNEKEHLQSFDILKMLAEKKLKYAQQLIATMITYAKELNYSHQTAENELAEITDPSPLNRNPIALHFLCFPKIMAEVKQFDCASGRIHVIKLLTASSDLITSVTCSFHTELLPPLSEKILVSLLGKSAMLGKTTDASEQKLVGIGTKEVFASLKITRLPVRPVPPLETKRDVVIPQPIPNAAPPSISAMPFRRIS